MLPRGMIAIWRGGGDHVKMRLFGCAASVAERSQQMQDHAE